MRTDFTRNFCSYYFPYDVKHAILGVIAKFTAFHQKHWFLTDDLGSAGRICSYLVYGVLRNFACFVGHYGGRLLIFISGGVKVDGRKFSGL